jgi:hypothetical protein
MIKQKKDRITSTNARGAYDFNQDTLLDRYANVCR